MRPTRAKSIASVTTNELTPVREMISPASAPSNIPTISPITRLITSDKPSRS